MYRATKTKSTPNKPSASVLLMLLANAVVPPKVKSSRCVRGLGCTCVIKVYSAKMYIRKCTQKTRINLKPGWNFTNDSSPEECWAIHVKLYTSLKVHTSHNLQVLPYQALHCQLSLLNTLTAWWNCAHLPRAWSCSNLLEFFNTTLWIIVVLIMVNIDYKACLHIFKCTPQLFLSDEYYVNTT